MTAWVTLALALVLAACSGASGNVLKGTFTLNDEGVEQHVGSCNGTGGYADFKPGMPVTVKNEAGTVIATGSLGPGQYLKPKVCTFAFAVPGVPEATFYSVEVSHRGALTYSFAEMESRGWSVALTLGG